MRGKVPGACGNKLVGIALEVPDELEEEEEEEEEAMVVLKSALRLPGVDRCSSERWNLSKKLEFKKSVEFE